MTPLDPRVVALAGAPVGSRVALAGLAADGFVELLVADLDPPGGVRLIGPSAGLALEAGVPAPRVLWSEDGRRLAIGGLVGSSADHVLTMAFDLRASAARPSIVFGRPMQWQGESLCVSLAGAHTAWDAARDAETAWDGTLRFVSPDRAVTVTVAADGAVTLAPDGASARPLVNAPPAVTWVGPRHLATDDGRALDLATRTAVDILPRGGRAVVVALSADGASGVFTRAGELVWASAR